jgi:hypothetical protein
LSWIERLAMRRRRSDGSSESGSRLIVAATMPGGTGVDRGCV